MSPISTPSLREKQHPLVRQLANCIESIWQCRLDLSPYALPDDLGYIEGRWEGEKFTIENRCYQTPQFRKLHLELARVGERLDILHCVMFPHPIYALPIFGTDLVGGQKQISAAVVDLSPISPTRTLPADYCLALNAFPEADFSQPRPLPHWGDIFSEFCLFVRPMDRAEETLFLNRAEAFLQLHCDRALATPPAPPDQHAEILLSQRYYCARQLQNNKTRRVLENAFGSEWADRYMTTVLFDAVAAVPVH